MKLRWVDPKGATQPRMMCQRAAATVPHRLVWGSVIGTASAIGTHLIGTDELLRSQFRLRNRTTPC